MAEKFQEGGISALASDPKWRASYDCVTRHPAKAGVQGNRRGLGAWIPAFAGMTNNPKILLDSFLVSLLAFDYRCWNPAVVLVC